jgi:hypothetical protein
VLQAIERAFASERRAVGALRLKPVGEPREHRVASSLTATAVRALVWRGRISRPDTAPVPVRRGRPRRAHLEVRRRLDRIYLEATGALLARVFKWSALRAWGTRLAKRVGINKGTCRRRAQAGGDHAPDLARRHVVQVVGPSGSRGARLMP